MALIIKVVDLHTNGEPFRVVVDTEPKVVFPEGLNLVEKRRYMASHHDVIRKLTMHEPRGHGAMYGGFLTQPDAVNRTLDLAVLFLRGLGYGVMCGHGVLALARFAVDFDLVEKTEPETRVSIQVPAGVVEAFAEVRDGRGTGNVRFIAPNAFLYASDLQVQFRGKTITVDIAYGGCFYVLVTAADVGADLRRHGAQELFQIGFELKRTVAEQHPIEIRDPRAPPDYKFLDGAILCCARNPSDLSQPLEHVVILAAQVDRSPCGSGTTARIAALAAKGLARRGRPVTFRNPLVGPRSQFVAEVLQIGLSEVPMGTDFVAVENGIQSEVRGQAFVTGESSLRLEQHDIFPEGLEVRP